MTRTLAAPCFWDQHNEPRRFCIGTISQPLLRARLPVEKLSFAARRDSCQPRAAEANFEQAFTRYHLPPKHAGWRFT